MNLELVIKGVKFKNPVWVASGTFGYASEFADFLRLSSVGAIVTKTVTLLAREGNPPPRIVETASGLLNSIGLENKGAEYFTERYASELKKIKTRLIISIAGFSEEEFAACAEKILEAIPADGIEANLSCPNVSHSHSGYKLLSQDPKATEAIIKKLRKKVKCLLAAKLTPNVTDIAVTARGAEQGGADLITASNTYFGMAVDADTMRPVLGNIVGGLSGPAIKPLALKAVRDVHRAVGIPVIGSGGIMSGRDAAEFMLAGAAAIQIGTANFVDPDAQPRILKELTDYMNDKKIRSLKDITGKLQEEKQGFPGKAR